MKKILFLALLFSGAASAQRSVTLYPGSPQTVTVVPPPVDNSTLPVFVRSGANVVGTTSLVVPMPDSIQVGDLIVIAVSNRHQTPMPTLNTPTDWTMQGSFTGGADTIWNDMGSARVTYFTSVATGSEPTNKGVTITGASVSRGQMFLFRKTSKSYTIQVTGGGDNTEGLDVVVPMGSVNIQSGDRCLVSTFLNTDLYTYSNYSLTVPGASFGVASVLTEGPNTTGDDYYNIITSRAATAAGTGNATFSATASGTALGRPLGASILMVIR